MKKQLSGIEKAFRMVWDADKIYPFLLLLQALVVSASPLYTSLCVSLLISALAGGGRMDSIILILSLLLFGNLLLRHWKPGLSGSVLTDICACRTSLP